MTKIQRIKKRYTLLSLLIVCSIVLIFNLILSSSSKTDIIKPDFTKLDNLERSKVTPPDRIKLITDVHSSTIIQEPAAEPELPPEIAPRRQSPQFTTKSREVDVQSAVSDKHIKEDDKIRTLGWEKYGQKLQKIGEQDKKKKDEPECEE